MANLPTVSSPLPRDLQQFVQRVREVLDGAGEDAVVTARQLIAAGVVQNKNGGGFTTVNGPIEAPRAPSNLSASGALANIILSWDAPTYTGHAYTEIWAHTLDVIGDAVLVGMTAGNNFAHNLGNAATRYYWVKNVNQNGVASSFNATNGVQATTGTSPTYLLSLLTDEITSSQLATSLGDRIDLIDGAAGVAGSVNARITTEATNTTNALALKADASVVTSLATTVGANSTAITSETTARTNADTAIASDVTTLQTTTGGHTTSIQTNATSVDGLEAQYTVKIDNNGHVSGFGLASELVNGTLISDFMVAADRFSVVNPNVSLSTISWIDEGYPTTQVYVFLPLSVWNAYTFVSGDTMNVTGLGGRNNEYEILSKNNILGLGKVLTVATRSVTSGTPYTYLPNTSNSTIFGNTYPNAKAAINLDQKAPFIISTGSTTINGVTVPAGVYMNSAMIGDATITNAKIGDAAIDSAKIANATIVAADIANATITGAKIDSATITNANIASGTITSANIQDATIATADIANGAIENAKIGNVIQSAAYSAGSAGWKIDKTGAMEMNNATFRGTLDVGGSSGSRVKITSDKIEVYNGSTLRVKIGNLA